jgi:peptidoglycan/xylan/chitin deacetylase (PgdA/CDA1 family)
MDGTASLSFYLSSLEDNRKAVNEVKVMGGTVRTDTTKKEIHLIFSGDEYADGVETIAEALKAQNVKGSFFFTGGFIERFPEKVKLLNDGGHYIGPHSGNHLLYAPWEKRDSLLVTKEEFRDDLLLNYRLLAEAGANIGGEKVFLPPYEWHNDSISVWSAELGIKVINFTPGVRTNADYTIPSMGEKYYSTEKLRELLFAYEEQNNLNGAIILIHAGTHPERTDKFYSKLDQVISKLKILGYSLSRF